MSEYIKRLRTATTELSLAKLSYNSRSPYLNAGQVSMRDYQAQINKLPAVATDPLQDMDPLSATYGSFFFMVGYSVMDGPDVVI